MKRWLSAVAFGSACAFGTAAAADEPPDATAPPSAVPAPAGAPTGAPAPRVPATGYGYSDAKAPRRPAVPRAGATRNARRAIVASFPGFEMLVGGGSRVTVRLTKAPAVEERDGRVVGAKGAAARRAKRATRDENAAKVVTYVLRGVTLRRRNDGNPLVTTHFDTPLARARLVRAGADLHVVLELRADVKPTFAMVNAKDGGAVLQIDLPAGSFLPAGEADAASPSASPPEE